MEDTLHTAYTRMNGQPNVLVYAGTGGAEVPHDVVHLRVHPSVTSIPASAFNGCNKLTEVELCEGLVEIGAGSFDDCGHSITKINIPISLRRINDWAFMSSLRCPIRLHDGIESIGGRAFATCIFTNFRVPPLITEIPNYMLSYCKSMFSVEIPHNVTEINEGALHYCYCLRNIAFPPNAVFDENILIGTGTDLHQLFGSIAEIMRALSHRFDGLLIHSIVYYQSYNQEVLQNLISASELDPTGNQQDCLGMTPLHILTCSSVHNLELYRVIVDKYPTNLITKDRWGAVPLLYAFWGAAPAEIIQFLLNSYRSLYPGYVFNWMMMVETMGRCDTPKESIENLLCVRQMHFPEQPIDWEYLLDEFVKPSDLTFHGSPFQERMQFLVMCGISDRVEALAFKLWRDHILKMIHTAKFQYNEECFYICRGIREKIVYFEDEYPKLKECTTILELALWKLRMNESILLEKATRCRKKVKTDESSMRMQCRVTCGADVIIRHVLPYLIVAVTDEESKHTVICTQTSRWPRCSCDGCRGLRLRRRN